MLNVDFHIHTKFSKCSNLEPNEIIQNSRKNGFDVIVITDHNTIKGALEVKKLSMGNPLVIIGEEISTDIGDIIVLPSDGGYSRNIETIIERSKKKNSIVIVPHLYDVYRHGVGMKIKNNINDIDVIETPNARSFGILNYLSSNFADKYGKVKIAGSDAHFINEIGSCYNILDCEKNVKSVLKCIRNGKIKTVQKRRNFTGHYNTIKLLLKKHKHK